MNSEQVKATQTYINDKGFGLGAIDGQWGPKCKAALAAFLESITPAKRFPTRREIAAGNSIFGRHGSATYTPPLRKIELPFTIFYEDKEITTLRPHEECSDALFSVFQRLDEMFPQPVQRRACGIATYDGLYNPRLMRGSSTQWSMHAWAIAIDFDAEHNMLKMPWPDVAVMPIQVIECFTREGFWSLGARENRDAMHFEATSGA